MKKLTILFLSAIFIFSCNKKDPAPACTKSAASISGSYKITAMTYKADAASTEADVFSLLDACEKDDIYTFQQNGTYQLKDAGLVCNPSDDDNGTWSVSGNTMTVDGDDASIENFDCNTLVLVNTDTQTPGDKFKITLTRQ
jgi:hypothetical protein